MDAGYKGENGNFSLRAAALIIHDKKLLVAKSQDYDCYYTVGGGIRQNEHLFWLPIEELGGINLVPVFLKTALQDIPKEVTRVVSYE